MPTEERPSGQTLLSFYGESLAAYVGEGTLTLKDARTMSCTFEAGQLKNGSVFLLCNFAENDPFLPHVPAQRFDGTTSEGFHVSVEDEITNTNYLPDHVPDQSGTPAAYLVRQMTVQKVEGIQVQSVRIGITNFICTKRILLHLAHDASNGIMLSVEPVRGYEGKMMRLRTLKGIDVTCEVIGDVLGGGSVERLKIAVNDLCYLLSLARRTTIQWVYYDYYDSSGNCLSSTLSPNNR